MELMFTSIALAALAIVGQLKDVYQGNEGYDAGI
jgi:hypothetical protein